MSRYYEPAELGVTVTQRYSTNKIYSTVLSKRLASPYMLYYSVIDVFKGKKVEHAPRFV